MSQLSNLDRVDFNNEGFSFKSIKLKRTKKTKTINRDNDYGYNLSYFFPDIKDLDVDLEAETKRWLNKYPDWMIENNIPIERIYFCGYTEKDILKYVSKAEDKTKKYIDYLKKSGTPEALNTAKFFKDKKLYPLISNGNDDYILYCNNGNLYFFIYEEDCRIDLNNTATIPRLLDLSKFQCIKNKELMILYNKRNNSIKESKMLNLNNVEIR